jgi:hypothetical protein
MTRMGKTTLAVQLARQLKAKGYPIAVLTVPGAGGRPDPRWAFADLVTTDRARFLRIVRDKDTWGPMLFIDEANQTVGKYDPEMEATATAGSLNGMTCHYIAQRAATFNRTVREQCSRLIMFRQGPKDSAELAEQFGQPGLADGALLCKGQYLYCTTEPGSLKRGKVPGL